MMNPRQVFSRVGFAYAAYLTISTASQLLAAALLQPFRARMGEDLWFVVCMLCMYPAAFLVFWLLMRRIPKDPAGRPDMPLRAGRFLGIFIICVGVMYAGNLLGQLISQMADRLTGRQSVNAVVELVMGMDTWAVFLAAVAAAPVMEELLFRKLLLDRVSVFGDRTAILLSGVVFGLAHGNFYQFFYAFGLGSIFAWVYLRTRRIRFSILLHVLINFCGSILPMQLLHIMRGLSGDRRPPAAGTDHADAGRRHLRRDSADLPAQRLDPASRQLSDSRREMVRHGIRKQRHTGVFPGQPSVLFHGITTKTGRLP